jgi:hypothetical protein
MSRPQFEYKILNISRFHLKKVKFQEEMLSKFNELGKEGWELISAEGLSETSVFLKATETVEIIYVFKRQLF